MGVCACAWVGVPRCLCACVCVCVRVCVYLCVRVRESVLVLNPTQASTCLVKTSRYTAAASSVDEESDHDYDCGSGCDDAAAASAVEYAVGGDGHDSEDGTIVEHPYAETIACLLEHGATMNAGVRYVCVYVCGWVCECVCVCVCVCVCLFGKYGLSVYVRTLRECAYATRVSGVCVCVYVVLPVFACSCT